MDTIRGSKRFRFASQHYTDSIVRRVCAVEGCGTVLSRYNLDATCAPHTPIRFPIYRDPKPLTGPSVR